MSLLPKVERRERTATENRKNRRNPYIRNKFHIALSSFYVFDMIPYKKCIFPHIVTVQFLIYKTVAVLNVLIKSNVHIILIQAKVIRLYCGNTQRFITNRKMFETVLRLTFWGGFLLSCLSFYVTYSFA